MLKKSDLSIALFFFAVYAMSLTFNYVEGDDATTIAYHAAGRDPSLFSPYSLYHCGFDLLLGLLPANETILRITAIAVSAISQLVFVILLMRLVFAWAGIDADSKDAALISLAVLLAIPELFFLGLLYNPSSVAAMLVVGAHLFLRARTENHERSLYPVMVASALLFGLGVAFRWNVILYGAVIIVDMVLTFRRPQLRIIQYLVLYGGLCVLGVLFWLSIAGIGLSDVKSVLSMSHSTVDGNRSNPLAYRYLGSSALWTPAMMILLLYGTTVLVKKQRARIFLLMAGLLPFAVFNTIHPKMVVTALPVLVLGVVVGIEKLFKSLTVLKLRRVFQFGILAVLFLPWLIGVEITTTATAYGPGFERGNTSLRNTSQDIAKDVRLAWAIRRLDLAMFDGFMIPTSEGPRPLGGYSGILLGGKWRQFVRSENREFRSIIGYADEHRTPIIIIRGDPYIETTLLREGFRAMDKEYNRIQPGIVKRSFQSSEMHAITIYKVSSFEGDRNNDVEGSIIDHAGTGAFILFSTYSSIIAEVRKKHGGKVQDFGERSVVFTY